MALSSGTSSTPNWVSDLEAVPAAPVSSSAAPSTTVPAGSVPDSFTQLADTFSAGAQVGDQWCWLACAVAIVGYFPATAVGGYPSSQCGVFRDILSKVPPAFDGTAPATICTCTNAPFSGDCDQNSCVDGDAGAVRGVLSTTLEHVLGTVVRLPIEVIPDSDPKHDQAPEIVKSHIATHKVPVGVLIRPAGARLETTKHYVLIVGYDDPRGEFHVWDPDDNHGHVSQWNYLHWNRLGKWLATVLVTPTNPLR